MKMKYTMYLCNNRDLKRRNCEYLTKYNNGRKKCFTLTYKALATRYNFFVSLWNNSLIRISILRDYWLETIRDGHKHLLIYLDKCMGVYLNPLLRA